MFHGIASHSGQAWSEGLQPERNSRAAQQPRGEQSHTHARAAARARAEVLDAEVSRIGALQVSTDDGDTISISFAALEQLHAESFRGKAGGARLAYGSTSQTSGVSVDISVNGSLDEQEVADIGELLQQLSQAISDPGATPDAVQLEDGGGLASLNAFQFDYQEQVAVDYSSSRVRATA